MLLKSYIFNLSKENKELLHTLTAQGIFACRIARPNISPVIAYLSTRAKQRLKELG